MKKLLTVLVLVLVLNLLTISVVRAEEEQSFSLEEIVVTASKHPEKLSDSAVSIEVIDTEDIKQKNAHNVADLLRDVASVKINDNGGLAGQKTISIRGSSSKQVLILIDGIKMNDPQNGGLDLSQLSIEQIKKIEVLRGGISTLYGANALGGVVNITTKNGSKEPETIFNLAYGSFNTEKYDAIHRGSSEKLSYNISISKKKSDGHRANSGLDHKTIFTKFNYDLDNYSDLLLSLQYNDSDKEVPGSVAYSTPNAEQNDENINTNLQWKRQTENSDMNLAVYYNDAKRYYDGDTTIVGYSEHEKNKTGLDFNQTLYNEPHKIIYGGELVRENVESENIKDEEQNSVNKALFIQDEWKVTNLLKVIVSGRYDDHEEYDSEFSSHLRTAYTINPKLNLHVSLGEAYRAPTFDELYGTYSSNWGSWHGNPDLVPETSQNYELGMKYLNERSKMEFNLFKRNVEDMINGNYFDPNKGYSTAINIDSAELSGVELLLDNYLTEQLSTNLDYTYLDTRDKKTDESLDDKVYHNLNVRLNYESEFINGSLNGQLVADRTNDLPSYFVVDTKLRRAITNNINLSIEINNLLDRSYQVSDGYPMPERNYMMTVSTNF